MKIRGLALAALGLTFREEGGMPTKRRVPGGGDEERVGAAGRKRKVRFQTREDSEEDESDDPRQQKRRPPISRRMADEDEEEEGHEGVRGRATRKRGRGGAGARGSRNFVYDDEEEEERGSSSDGRGKGRGAGTDLRGEGSGGGRFDGEDDEEEDDEQEVERMVEEVHGEEEEGEHYERMNEAGDPIEPFNLRNERDIGYFDTNGNFVWKREDNERDAWLAEMDEGTMEEAIGAASTRATKKEDGAGAAGGAAGASPGGRDAVDGMGTAEMREELIPLLEEGETVVQALRRLGKQKKGPVGRGRLPGDKKKPGDAKDKDGDSRANGKAASGGSGIGEETGSSAERGGGGKCSADKEAVDAAERKRREDFGRLTDLADGLLQAGLHDVYQLTKEELEEAAAEAAETDRGWASSSASYFGRAMGGGMAGYHDQHRLQGMQRHEQQQHEYQASAADGMAVTAGTDESAYFVYRGKDDNIHGPYGASQMKGWVQEGYFDGDQAVMMRKVFAGNDKMTTGEGAGIGGGDTGGGAKKESAPGAKPSNEDLMADLDDEDEEEGEEKTRGENDMANGGGGGAESAKAEEWILSDRIDWSLY